MKVIKFRVWCDVEEFYSYFTLRDLALNGFAYSNDWHCCVWQQYTGLKDKKGNEIYEGDIVVSDNHEMGVVDFFESLSWESSGSHSGYYCQSWFEYKDYGQMSYHSHFSDCKIIGNICENPELIEKAE